MTHQKKNVILIIDDELPIRKLLRILLEGHDYKTMDCDQGKAGVRLVASALPDLVMLDMGLPDMNGLEVIRQIREWSQVPIIVCSAHKEDAEVIAALDAGADDYVLKPFNPEILLARLNVNLRKLATRSAGEPELQNGHIRMDLVRHEVFLNQKKTSFTPKEYDLLRYFLVNSGKMLTHKQILHEVWGTAHSDDMQCLRVYVSQLREKIEGRGSAAVSFIVTEPGIGYRMEVVNP